MRYIVNNSFLRKAEIIYLNLGTQVLRAPTPGSLKGCRQKGKSQGKEGEREKREEKEEGRLQCSPYPLEMFYMYSLGSFPPRF